MLKYVIVFLAGVIVATIGFSGLSNLVHKGADKVDLSGVANVLDNGVSAVKKQSKELAQ